MTLQKHGDLSEKYGEWTEGVGEMEPDPDSGMSNQWTYQWSLILMKLGQIVEDANYVHLMEKQTENSLCLLEI